MIKINFPNFDLYEGETKIDNSEIPDGYGIMIYPNGSIQAGRWENWNFLGN